MASRKKKATELVSEADPAAPLDGARLLSAAAPVLKVLEASVLERAEKSAAVTAVLKDRHAKEKEARRTAEPFEVWRRGFAEQVAAGWFLSCVFVRVLEDRGLLDRARIAGPGAVDSQRAFFEIAPSLGERDYLLTVFRELSSFPAARELFDERHNPVWLLGPSAEACRELLALFRAPNADAPSFRFGSSDTRFLGDLYQDLNENVRARYALLQTPRFVESFILDRTLEPAIERFGLDDTTLIDPTCGSGHFLLGAFDRLFEHRLRREPGLEVRAAAKKALDAVYGADINPYAVAIARFRLTLSFLEKAGFGKLRNAPEIHTNLAVADSLLYNPGKPTLAQVAGQRAAEWFGGTHALDDDEAARAVLGRAHSAVVGNPPYITVKDAALRDLYREGYPKSAAGKYSLATPFTECFFQLARERGRVGMITANSFMKREFGKRLIEEYLREVNLDLVVNTSGAFIPGHGTPTVLLFGSHEKPQGAELEVVLASRGEPSTPEEPEKGLVWSSIAGHWNEQGFENEFISVARFERKALAKHPWSLGGGGATELKELLEERAEKRLGEIATIGVFGMTNADDCMLMDHSSWKRTPVEEAFVRPLAIGEEIRDWSWKPTLSALYPYHWPSTLVQPSEAPGLFRYLWPFRTSIGNRATFGGGTYFKDGLAWWKWHQVTVDRVEGPAITFAFVATHNHFVLDRGGKVFKQSAPIIKLPESATEDDHLALLAYLNSSTACFWMRQVFSPKGMHNGSEANATSFLVRFEFDGTKLASLPLPEALTASLKTRLAALGRRVDSLQRQRQALNLESIVQSVDPPLIQDACRAAVEAREALRDQAIAMQEEIDWSIYVALGLVDETCLIPEEQWSELHMPPGARPFETFLSQLPEGHPHREWFRWNQTRPHQPPTDGVFALRVSAIMRSRDLQLLESPETKRRWTQPSGKAAQELEKDTKVLRDEASEWLDSAIEQASVDRAIFSARNVVTALVRKEPAGRVRFVCTYIDAETPPERMLAERIQASGVPFLAAHRHSETGLEKRALWEKTWNLQRREDAGENVGDIPVPPKYDQKDFRDPNYFRLRGKLDVPKERFISYPGCESDEDGEPVYGWAGWNHLERARALAALYQDRKTREGWKKDRLLPMLAGLLELIPWVKQWHNEPSADFDGLRLGDYFESFLRGECTEHGFTEQTLRAFRPEPKGRARAKKRAANADTDDDVA